MEKKIKSKKFVKKIIMEKKKIPFFNYALSKFLFTKISILVSKKMKIKCRVIRLFHVYGKNENKNNLQNYFSKMNFFTIFYLLNVYKIIYSKIKFYFI